jgi:PAS domain S-box-containing protein
MLGYSEAEMMARTIHEITHPEDIEWDLLQRDRALAGEIETYQWEKRYIHRSGSIVWGHLSCSLVRDADRKPLHFIMQVQDITERKATEQVLRESEERFRTLTALASDWFWEQDENYRFVQVSANAGGAHLVVGSSEQAIGKTPWELDHMPMDEAAWAEHRAKLDRRELFRDFEITRRARDGQIRYVTISGVPVFDAAGVFKGYRGTGRDTTEMRRVNEALRASEAQLLDITDTLPAIISYVDADRRFRFHNRAYAEGLGVPREEINGRTMLEVLGEEGYELARPWVDEVLSGYPVRFERHRKTPQGEFRDFIVNYFPRYGDGPEAGRVIGFYALGTDVTELKQIERMKSELLSAAKHLPPSDNS